MCDRDSDSLILEARQLFNATIVAINSPAGAIRKLNRHTSERHEKEFLFPKGSGYCVTV
jgi:hypothetical protein